MAKALLVFLFTVLLTCLMAGEVISPISLTVSESAETDSKQDPALRSVSLEPSSVDFGDVPIGHQVSQQITLTCLMERIEVTSCWMSIGDYVWHDINPGFYLNYGESLSFNLYAQTLILGYFLDNLQIDYTGYVWDDGPGGFDWYPVFSNSIGLLVGGNVIPIEPSFTLISPADHESGVILTPTFEWSYNEGDPPWIEMWYNLSIVNAANPAESYYFDGNVEEVYSPFTPDLSLNFDTTYNWSVSTDSGYSSDIHTFTTLPANLTISGDVYMSYNGSPVEGLIIKVLDENNNMLSSCQTEQDGSYLVGTLSNIPVSLVVESQTVEVDGDMIDVAPYSQEINISENLTQNIGVEVSESAVNAENCTFIGNYNGHSYWRSNWATYWEYAYNECVNRGGNLISIADASENQFIADYFLINPNALGGAWIGLTNILPDWIWTDGTPFSYTNWAPGEPSGDSGVGVMYDNGTWNDHWYWDANYEFILESNGLTTPLVPKSVTSLNVQQQRDFTINLSWTNPIEVLCGLNLNNGFEIQIKRDSELVATLGNCTAGANMNWQEFVLTGRHTYAVYAVNEYGESTPVSQSISYGNQVQGVARLNNVADHSGIKVKFIADPSTPAAVSDSTYTNVNGFYSINLTIGRYTIIYSKAGYLDQTYNNYLHDGPYDLPEQTLEYVGQIMYLSGSLSGTLTADYAYIINSQIWVDSGNTLLLQPGVRFYFKNGVGFDVNGTLTAIGTTQNPILFTSVTSEIRGEFWLNAHGSVLEHCEFTNGTWALRLNSNSHVSHSKFHNNNIGIGIMDSAGESCLFDYNEIYENTEHAILLYCYGAVIEHNEIYNNNVTGHIIYRDYDRAAQVTNNYIHHNHSTSTSSLIYIYYYNWFVFSNNVVECNTGEWLFRNYYYTHITFNNNIIQNNQCNNLILTYGENCMFENNLICNNNGTFHVQGGGQTVIHNTIIGNTGTGLAIWGGSNQLIRQNTVVGNAGIGMDVYDSPTIHDNLVAFNGGTELRNNTSNNSLYNNLFYDTSGTLSENGGGLPFLLDLQATNANGTPCDSYYNISTDPLFFDFANDNFNLLPTSPCINAGDPSSTLDPDGTIADLGAYYYDLNASSHAQIAIPLSLYNFQAIAVGDTLIWNCPFRNTGTDPLIISSIQLNNPAFFLASQTRSLIPFSISIPPSQTGYIPIGFTPSAVADYADTLRINSNALMNPQVSIRLFGAGTISSSVTLAMPQNTTVNVLSNFSLPLTVSDTTPYNILSYNMSLTFDPAIFEFVGLESTGTLSEDWFVQVNSAGAGVLHIGGAGTTALAGSGNLFKLNFHTLSGIFDGTESFVNISQVVFNEGGITIQDCFASVTIRNIIYGDVDDNLAIQAYDAALALQYSVMMDPLPVIDPRPWVDWRKQRADVSGDGNIFAYDASLILQRVVGLITSFPVEQTRPEPPLATVEIAFYNNQLILSSPDFSTLYGLNLSIANPEGLPFGTVQMSEAFSEAITNQFEADDTWHFALATITPPQGSGTICIIPLNLETATQLALTLVVNESSADYTVDCQPLTQTETPLVGFNYLSPNSPNPFNPSTTIYYGLKNNAAVELEVYNLKGQKVKTLVNEAKQAGSYSVVWNGRDEHGSPVGSGIYFSRIRIGNNWTKTQKMMLMK